jgi:hypothetical protein
MGQAEHRVWMPILAVRIQYGAGSCASALCQVPRPGTGAEATAQNRQNIYEISRRLLQRLVKRRVLLSDLMSHTTKVLTGYAKGVWDIIFITKDLPIPPVLSRAYFRGSDIPRIGFMGYSGRLPHAFDCFQGAFNVIGLVACAHS